MILTSLIRFIFVLTLDEKDLNNENNNLFKTIAFLIILGTLFFFTFYCISWCYIYYNTQISWLYMGIWCLLIKWILALIVIGFIIFFEKYNKNINEKDKYEYCSFNFELFSCF